MGRRAGSARVEAVGDAIPNDALAWQHTIDEIALRVRRARRLLGLSQDELAKLAHVSQGAISRLECGRGFNVPLLTYAKVSAALTTALGQLPIGGSMGTIPLAVPDIPDIRMRVDPVLESVVRGYQDLLPRERVGFGRIVGTLLETLTAVRPSARVTTCHAQVDNPTPPAYSARQAGDKGD